MSKLTRRSFLGSAAVVGSGLLGGAIIDPIKNATKKSAQIFGEQNSDDAKEENKIISTQAPHSVVPKHIHWAFGGQEYSSLKEAKSSEFSFWMTPTIERRKLSFRDEVFNACKKIDAGRNGKTVALCHGGGLDSEVLAIALHNLGIPYELYFFDNWGLNQAQYDGWVRPFAEKFKKKLNVVSFSRTYFIDEFATKSFAELGCENPTTLAITHMFDSIPTSQYIVTGDGSLDRTGPLFKFIGKQSPLNETEVGKYMPFTTSSIAYYQWAKNKNRSGEFYFYSSTPELIGAMITDPKFGLTYPEAFTVDVIHAAFPEVRRREKSTNWDGWIGESENSWIRRETRRNHVEAFGDYWKASIHAKVNVEDIFIYQPPKA